MRHNSLPQVLLAFRQVIGIFQPLQLSRYFAHKVLTNSIVDEMLLGLVRLESWMRVQAVLSC